MAAFAELRNPYAVCLRIISPENVFTAHQSARRLQEQAEASVSVLPVRIDGAEGVAFEDSFQQGVKRESLRSLCRVVNATQLPLEVALTKLQAAPAETGAMVVRRTPQQAKLKAPPRACIATFARMLQRWHPCPHVPSGDRPLLWSLLYSSAISSISTDDAMHVGCEHFGRCRQRRHCRNRGF